MLQYKRAFHLGIRYVTHTGYLACDMWVFGLVCIVGYLTYRRAFTSSKVNYPPGPRPYPFIGNPFDIPPTFQEVAFAKLAKQYGAVSLFKALIHA
jgi:hypothetical protein